MTQSIDAERSEFEGYALSVGLSLRTAGFGYYEKLETCSAWAAWQAARRAPAAPMPKCKDRLLAALERAISAETALRQLIDEAGNDMTPGWEDRLSACIDRGNELLAAAPQPPDSFQTEGGLKSEIRTTSTAPVQMPEPIAYLHECGKKPSLRTLEFSKVAIQLSSKGYKSHGLYTEQQVRQLLATHGIMANK